MLNSWVWLNGNSTVAGAGVQPRLPVVPAGQSLARRPSSACATPAPPHRAMLRLCRDKSADFGYCP
jgi:hypothetical protein